MALGDQQAGSGDLQCQAPLPPRNTGVLDPEGPWGPCGGDGRARGCTWPTPSPSWSWPAPLHQPELVSVSRCDPGPLLPAGPPTGSWPGGEAGGVSRGPQGWAVMAEGMRAEPVSMALVLLWRGRGQRAPGATGRGWATVGGASLPVSGPQGGVRPACLPRARPRTQDSYSNACVISAFPGALGIAA